MYKYISVPQTQDNQSTQSIKAEIKSLLKKKNAILLSHVYQRMEIQDIADFVGDSFELSKIARNTPAEVIIFCGVHFMAETAKLLSPHKTVLLPEENAGCPMADMINPCDVEELRKTHPNTPVMCYVNSSLAVKAESDYCCTSSNAVEIARRINSNKIIFIPDKCLGYWVQKNLPEKEIILFNAFCPTHYQINAQRIKEIKQELPQVFTLAHPECERSILELANYIGSTSQMYKFAQEDKHETFLVLSELGLVERMSRNIKGKFFCTPYPSPICPNMKLNTLESVLECLKKDKYEIRIPEYGVKNGLFERAENTVNNMFEILSYNF